LSHNIHGYSITCKLFLKLFVPNTMFTFKGEGQHSMTSSL